MYGVPAISGCLLIEQLAQQDGQGDAHEEEHDAAASGNDADPGRYSLDHLILANVGPEESEQQNSREQAKESADEAAKRQVGQESKRLLQLGHRPVQLGEDHFGHRCLPAVAALSRAYLGRSPIC